MFWKTKSLKDIQPQLAASMDSLLADLAVQDEIKINFSHSGQGKKQRSGYTKQFNSGKMKAQQERSNQRSVQKKQKLLPRSAQQIPNGALDVKH